MMTLYVRTATNAHNSFYVFFLPLDILYGYYSHIWPGLTVEFLIFENLFFFFLSFGETWPSPCTVL
jgi:hypothetical protein